ncbi:quinone oxidoreductase family protein [Herbiconiux liukaitaii]|uniref:quinone oxidoreductase family protein n=1 Tax=Herbiconiux liukaitaii TaxID=3342799 RepID=UPI0035BA6919
MKAVRIMEHGDPSVLQYVDVEVPEIGPDEVLVRMHAAAINAWDLKYRAGQLPPLPLPGRPGWPLPFQLGRDGAGEVVRVGNRVTRWSVGDRVVQMPHPACGHCALCIRGQDNLCVNTSYPGHQAFGSYAEYVARRENALIAIPDGVGYEEAGSTLWAYTTPLNCARRRAPVALGETLVITGASGGLATAALQIAKLSGAVVIGTTTRAAKIPALLALGFDDVVDVTEETAVAEVRKLTGGLGADVVWDTVGGTPSFRIAASCVRVGGAIAVFGAPMDGGFALEMSTLSFLFGELDVVGVRAATRRDQEVCMEMLGRGQIAPVIDRVFPLADVAEAHRYLESGAQVGKVVLRM